MELALDTSTSTAGVALADQGRLLVEMTWNAGLDHTRDAMPMVAQVLDKGGCRTADLEAIVVAVGPGTFSGLRVGVSAAKGLATALGIPLVGVNTMAVEAYPHAWSVFPLRPVIDAGRGEVAMGYYRGVDGLPVEVEPPFIGPIEEACRRVDEPTLFCGAYAGVVRESIREFLGGRALMPPLGALPRRPSCLAALGWTRLAQGQGLVHGEENDPAAVQPIYLRAPSITKPKPPRPARR